MISALHSLVSPTWSLDISCWILDIRFPKFHTSASYWPLKRSGGHTGFGCSLLEPGGPRGDLIDHVDRIDGESGLVRGVGIRLRFSTA